MYVYIHTYRKTNVWAQENAARQLLRSRLIKEFWDPMSVKGCEIRSTIICCYYIASTSV